MIFNDLPSNPTYVQLFEAVFEGDLKKFKEAIVRPGVDVNAFHSNELSPRKCTLFQIACDENKPSIVRFMLNKLEGVNYNLVDHRDVSGLFIRVCYMKCYDVMVLLLQDLRINIQAASDLHWSPFWTLCLRGDLQGVKLHLAFGRSMNLQFYKKYEKASVQLREKIKKCKKRIEGIQADIEDAGRKEEGDTSFPSASNEIYLNILKDDLNRHATECASLVMIDGILVKCEVDIEKTIAEIRSEMLATESNAGELFAMIVYLSDGYLKMIHQPVESQIKKNARFFDITLRLPMELQMIMCNRVYDLSIDLVKKKVSNDGFKLLDEKF